MDGNSRTLCSGNSYLTVLKPSEFLTALWGSNPTAPILLWAKNEKESHWLSSPEQADKDWGNGDVYTGVALPDPSIKLGPSLRAKNHETSAIAGLWADVDYAGPLHEKPGLPNKETALRVLMQDIEPPTILVSSGYGYQGWWLFDEPMSLNSQAERDRATALVKWWQGEISVAMDAAIDATHDLARVLRLPGTRNHKGTEPVEVTAEAVGRRITAADWLRLGPESLLRASEASTLPTTPTVAVPGLDVLLSADASLSPDRLDDLIDAIPAIKHSLDHTTKIQDQSLSGYDLSIASLAIQAGLSEQEIVNLCIYHRRKHNGDLKIDRPDYWQRTLGAAQREKPMSIAEINELDLPQLGKLGIQRILCIRNPEHPDAPQYRIVSEGGILELPSVNHITNQQLFRNACVNQIKKLPTKLPSTAWDEFVRRLIENFEDIIPGHPDHPRGETEAEETREWLIEYCNISYAPNAEEGFQLQQPFIHDDITHFHIHGLKAWLKIKRDIRMSEKEIASRLRDVGWEPKKVVINGSQIRFWQGHPTGEITVQEENIK